MSQDEAQESEVPTDDATQEAVAEDQVQSQETELPQDDTTTDPQGDLQGGDADPAEQTEAEAEAWRQQFAEIGLNDVEDLDTGIGRLTRAYQQREQQLRELAEANRRLARQVTTQQTTAPHQPEPQAAQAEDNDPFAMPQLPQGFERYRVLRRKDDGTEFYDWSEDTPAQIRQAGDEYASKVMDFQYKVSTPAGFRELLDSYMEKHVLPKVEETYETRQSQMTTQQMADQYLQENAGWFYETDSMTGKPLVDPASGDVRISPEGRQFQQIMQQLEADGVTNFARRLELADSIFSRQREQVAEQPAQQRQQAAQRNAEAKREMIGRKATRVTSQPTSSAAPSRDNPATRDQQSYGKGFIDELRANGVVLQ